MTYLANKQVVIDENLTSAQAAKTMLHEWAHAYLHAGHKGMVSPEEREIGEIEAESVAYIIAKMHGLDTESYSFGYLTVWSSQVDFNKEIRQSGKRIQEAVTTFLELLYPEAQALAA